ncbi:YHS domain family [Synechococcus sp. PCC 7335]|uniref:YHS domain-containing (seleno)protein n=1 Tax=Synechococcus sp. (strain ATCC 29403 / PCC 7335) TaxID=91464 RepID=UPI00017EE4A4|nr:YHS domain-containing (seleno)protein [Synechococcus sp. PCC 7335]EDX83366.1 YHS domain family [Synechococcus sp. PCC 7335]
MNHPVNLTKQNIAIQGYDPVSYFLGNPTAGESSRSVTHKGAIYHFSSDDNKAMFVQDPERYSPQYGGFCAKAIAEGKLVPINPETYTITNNKLYLFYNNNGTNAKLAWDADETAFIEKAEQQWANGELREI